MSAHVVIIGGGIAGIAAMDHLSTQAPLLRVTLLEARDRVGGHIRTDRQGGFLMEMGPDVLFAAKPAALAFCHKLGIAHRVIETNPAAKGSLVLRRGRLVPVPDGMSGLVPARIGPMAVTSLLSARAKLRLACEYLVPPRLGDSDESVKQFVVRRFGREMYDRLLEPLLSGIVAGDGGRLSIAALFPQLREQERRHGGLLRAMLAARRAAKATSTPAPGGPRGLVSLEGGLGELVEAFERAHAPGSVPTSTRVIRRCARAECIERAGARGYRILLSGGETLHADAVIVAAPTFEAASLLRSMDATLSSELEEIEYASTVTISVAVPSHGMRALPRGTGYTVPRAEGRSVMACTFVSDKFAGRARPGHTLFRFFLGGAGRGEFVDRSDAELTAIVTGELRDVLGVTASPELVRINRLPRALPQYAIGHLDLLARLEARLEALPTLALAGAAYRGVGIPDCIRSGTSAADRVLDALYAVAHQRGEETGWLPALPMTNHAPGRVLS